MLAFFSILKAIAADSGLYQNYNHHVEDSLNDANSLERVFYILLTAGIIYPFVEELSFRLWVTKENDRFFLGVGFLMILILLVISEFNEFLPFNSDLSFVIFFFTIGLLLAYLLLKLIPSSANLPPIKLLIVISSILFALVHLNVISTQSTLLGCLIVLLPYFIKGYFYGYINYRIGFRYSFLVHSLHNLILTGFILLMK